MAKKVLKGKQVKRDYFEYYHKELIKESDLFMCSFLRSCRIAANLTQKELGQRLHISGTLVGFIENGKPCGLSYVRYMPKWQKWVKACGVVVRFSFHSIKEDTDEIKKPYKKGARITEKDKQLIEGFKSVIPLKD